MQATNKKAARAAKKAELAAKKALEAQTTETQVAVVEDAQPESVATPSLAEIVSQISGQEGASKSDDKAPLVPPAELPCPFTMPAAPVKAKAAKGPNVPQIRILRFLAKGGAYSRKQIAGENAANVDYAYCTSYLGATREGCKCPDRVYPSLKTLGFVESKLGANGIVYEITAAGKAFVASLAKPVPTVPSAQGPVEAPAQG